MTQCSLSPCWTVFLHVSGTDIFSHVKQGGYWWTRGYRHGARGGICRCTQNWTSSSCDHWRNWGSDHSTRCQRGARHPHGWGANRKVSVSSLQRYVNCCESQKFAQILCRFAHYTDSSPSIILNCSSYICAATASHLLESLSTLVTSTFSTSTTLAMSTTLATRMVFYTGPRAHRHPPAHLLMTKLLKVTVWWAHMDIMQEWTVWMEPTSTTIWMARPPWTAPQATRRRVCCRESSTTKSLGG